MGRERIGRERERETADDGGGRVVGSVSQQSSSVGDHLLHRSSNDWLILEPTGLGVAWLIPMIGPKGSRCSLPVARLLEDGRKSFGGVGGGGGGVRLGRGRRSASSGGSFGGVLLRARAVPRLAWFESIPESGIESLRGGRRKRQPYPCLKLCFGSVC
ncbi:hypothetical protein IE53DRAFT_282724 [Violaceomyces palustris]|uniref:Uncharacterized protein n=1 Tax=Violaceomyces palustris TaxID=1673888 RepID=A0ACD0P313_9BASI|nr:hypothetical protein IE53DRAFT_282724 [Violaceomyces palustris]